MKKTLPQQEDLSVYLWVCQGQSIDKPSSINKPIDIPTKRTEVPSQTINVKGPFFRSHKSLNNLSY